MSPRHSELSRRDQGFPRVSGDEPTQEDELLGMLTFSPRERG